MCFQSGEESIKIPGSAAYSRCYHIPPKPKSDLGL